MKAIEDNEDKASKEKNDGRAEEKEGDKGGSNGESDKVEIKELSKEDDITIGTFGFAEKAVESTTSKAENPTTVIELEKKEDQSKKEGSANEDKNDIEKLIEVTIEKAGQESANGTSSGENPAPSVSPCRIYYSRSL